MKKFLLLFLSLLILPAFAADKIHVKSLGDFDTQNPAEFLNVEVIEDGEIDDVMILKGDIILGKITKVTDPKIGKTNAGIYLQIIGYQDKLGEHKFNSVLSAKYAKNIMSEQIKQTSPKKVAKKAALTVGDFYMKGLSYGVSFAEGVKNNTENNRLKSGFKNMYDESFFSLVKKGEEVTINQGDEFYLIIKKVD